MCSFESPVSVQKEILQLKALLDSAYQELYGQPAAPALAIRANNSTVSIDLETKPADDTAMIRSQQRSRAVLLQPCLINSKTQDSNRFGTSFSPFIFESYALSCSDSNWKAR
jgi:hypothetical protein